MRRRDEPRSAPQCREQRGSELELPKQAQLKLGGTGSLPHERFPVVVAEMNTELEPPDGGVQRHAGRARDLVQEGDTLGFFRRASAIALSP